MAYEVYKINKFPEESIPFKLLYITRSNYDKGWHSTPHTHHFTELFYIVRGKGAFMLPDEEILVQENDLVVINPNVEHTEKSNEQDSLEYIALGIEGLTFSLPIDHERKTDLFTYRGNQTDILFYLNKLLQEVQYQKEEYEVICRNIISIIISKLRRAKNVKVEKNTSKRMNQSVAFVKHYISQNFRDPITLDLLATIGNINKYYLVHIFKENLDITPIGYLNQIRIDEAKILLETTNLTLAEISHIIGFSSQSFFSQVFRRETGLTPSKYRKRGN